MRFKNLFFIGIMLILISVSFVKPDKSSTSVNEAISQFHSKFLYSDSSGVACFESEDFVSDALNNYTIAKLNHKFIKSLSCSKQSIVNKHDVTVIDTIYTYSNPENKIQIYRARQDDFIFTFDVTDPLYELAGNIRPGMSKDAFSRKLRVTETINDKVQFKNAEGSMRFMFYFENNRLKRINSYLYLD